MGVHLMNKISTKKKSIERHVTGINGLNRMLHGGIPTHHLVAVIGAFGTGKSTLAMQFTNQNLLENKTCVYINLDVSEEQFLETAKMFDWDFEKYIENEKLILVTLCSADISTSIMKIESAIPQFLESNKVDCIVFDSITLLEMFHTLESDRRNMMFNLCGMFKYSGATTLMTSEAAIDDPYSSKFGILEYLVDGVVTLRYVRPGGTYDVSLEMEVVKMRQTNHHRGSRPYAITENGIDVSVEAEMF